MAFDEGLAQILRDDLSELGTRITEKKMFGGLMFAHYGHMLCGCHSDKGRSANMAMFRVGPDNYDKALAIDGINPLTFTRSPMKGMVEAEAEIYEDDARRAQVLGLALEFTGSLKPK